MRSSTRRHGIEEEVRAIHSVSVRALRPEPRPGASTNRRLTKMVISDYHVTMKVLGVAEFKAKLSEYLRSVRRGHELTIYDRDQPIARVVPYAPSSPLAVREPAVHYTTLGAVPLPPPLALDVDVVELLLDDRRTDE
jgi:prevent-host-death family protein